MAKVFLVVLCLLLAFVAIGGAVKTYPVSGSNSTTACQFRVGSGAPNSGTGNNCDMYINTTTGDVYGPKTSGAWGSIALNIKGAAGPAGPTGAAGATGLPGATGPAGTASSSTGITVTGTDAGWEALYDNGGTNFIGASAPTSISSSYCEILPATAPTANQSRYVVSVATGTCPNGSAGTVATLGWH